MKKFYAPIFFISKLSMFFHSVNVLISILIVFTCYPNKMDAIWIVKISTYIHTCINTRCLKHLDFIFFLGTIHVGIYRFSLLLVLLKNACHFRLNSSIWHNNKDENLKWKENIHDKLTTKEFRLQCSFEKSKKNLFSSTPSLLHLNGLFFFFTLLRFWSAKFFVDHFDSISISPQFLNWNKNKFATPHHKILDGFFFGNLFFSTALFLLLIFCRELSQLKTSNITLWKRKSIQN